MKIIKSLILLITLFYGSCAMYEAVPPAITLNGEANASTALEERIQAVTGMKTRSTNHSNKSIIDWTSGENYIYKDAKQVGYKITDYFIWFHGESNFSDFSDYENNLKIIFNKYFIYHIPQFIIIQVYSETEDFSSFRAYQETMCNNNGWILIDSSDCDRYDGVNLSQSGIEQLAEKIRAEIYE